MRVSAFGVFAFSSKMVDMGLSRARLRSVSAALIAGLVLLCGCRGRPDPAVAAEVNGYKITFAELERYLHTQVPDVADPASEDQAQMLRLTVLRELIDRHVILQRAEKLGLMAVDSEVQATLDGQRAPLDNPGDFEKRLEERGLTLAEYEAELRRTITIDKLFNKEITSKMSVSSAEIRKYYDENKASFHLPEQQIRLAQILVTATPEIPVPNYKNDDAKDAETAQAKIEMIEQRLRNGEAFDIVAGNYSEDPVSTGNGGDLGFIPQSALEKTEIALRRVVASLSPGELSPIIRSGSEFRIIKLISRESAGQREYSDPRVQQSIRETLLNRKDQLLRTAYMESARNEAGIANYLADRVVESFGALD